MAELCFPDKLTPCAPSDLYDALYVAWPRLILDAAVSRASLLVLLAHWALETGFGHAMHHWNVGNKKHVQGDGHDYTMFSCTEIVDGKVVAFEPPDPATWFVAFPSLEDGAADYLVGLRGRFRAAWPAVVAGDPAEFCHMLKLARYYTADEAVYAAGVLRCYHQLDASIPQQHDGVTPALLAEEAAQLATADVPADERPTLRELPGR